MHNLLAIASLAIPFAAATLVPRAQAQPNGIVSLYELRHTSRPLLIFAPKPDDPQLEIQIRSLTQNAAQLAERDVVIIAVPYESPSPTDASLSPEEATEARRRFKIAPTDFTVILIGKDGGEKLRDTKPFTIAKLRDTIDAMPMRQDEIRAHSH